MRLNRFDNEKFFILLIFSTILVVFSLAFFNEFKADDFAWLYVSKITNSNLMHALTLDLGGFFRPYNHMLFSAWFNLFGLNPFGYHAVNILLFHFVSSVLVYYIARNFTKSRHIGLVSALIFATMAAHFDSTLFQSGGMVDNSLSTLFTLFSFIAFVKWNETNRKKYLFVSLLVFVLNLLSYESSVVLFPLLFMYLVFFSKKSYLGSLIGHVKKIILFAIPLVPYLAFQYWIQIKGHVVSIGIYGLGSHVFKNILDYFSSMLTLFPMIDVNYLSRIGIPKSVYPLISQGIIAVYVGIILVSLYIILKGSRSSKFFLAWYLIAVSPFLLFMTPVQSRYTYGASIGVAILMGAIIYDLYKRFGNWFGDNKARFISVAITLLILAGNSAALFVIEHSKFNNGVSDESIMIDFMKSKYPTLPEGSKLYFVSDTMPFKDLILIMTMSLYYPNGEDIPHTVAVDYNQTVINYTMYYPNYSIYEISRSEVNSIPRDNMTHIFDFDRSGKEPRGVEL